jgi:nitrous oxidase accessory protein NosD
VEDIHTHFCTRAGIEANPVTLTDLSQTITVRNCVVETVNAAGEGASVGAQGIVMLSCTAVVQNCIVRDMFPAGLGTSACIFMQNTTNSFVDNNLLSNAGIGLQVTGGGTNRVYYRNNLTAGCPIPFNISGGVDRGGNF